MPTGGGKSLCYQLPGLASEDLTIVVSPLIALMNDQWRRLTAAGHPVAMISSGMSDEAARDALAQVRSGEARIVYCAPERFGSNVFLDALAQRRIDLLAVDEAHCVSEWGHDFRPDYLRLPQIAERLGRPTVMACTATATEAVGGGDRRPLRPARPAPGPLRLRPPQPLLRRRARSRARARRRGGWRCSRPGLADPANRPAIVYCGTRKDTDEVAEALRGGGRRRARLPRRDGGGGPHRDPAPLHGRRGRRDRRHQRLRDGRRQGRRALGLAHGDPDQRRGLLPGGRPGRARRAAGESGAAGDARRPRPPGPLQRTARPRPGDRPRARLARLPRDQILHLLRPLPAPAAARPLRRPRRPARPLGRCCDRLRPGRLAAGPGDDRDPPAAARAARRRRRPADLSAADDAALRSAEGLAPRGRRRQARLHGRQQPHPRARSPRRGPADAASLVEISGVGPELHRQVRARRSLAIVASTPPGASGAGRCR